MESVSTFYIFFVVKEFLLVNKHLVNITYRYLKKTDCVVIVSEIYSRIFRRIDSIFRAGACAKGFLTTWLTYTGVCCATHVKPLRGKRRIAPRGDSTRNAKLCDGCGIGMIRVGKEEEGECAKIWCKKCWGLSVFSLEDHAKELDNKCVEWRTEQFQRMLWVRWTEDKTSWTREIWTE